MTEIIYDNGIDDPLVVTLDFEAELLTVTTREFKYRCHLDQAPSRIDAWDAEVLGRDDLDQRVALAMVGARDVMYGLDEENYPPPLILIFPLVCARLVTGTCDPQYIVRHDIVTSLSGEYELSALPVNIDVAVSALIDLL